jgi:aminoglycoside phosphotransferase family enzyme
VVALTQTADGYAIGGAGRVADWLVVMRKLNEDDTLEAALLRRKTSRADVERLAAVLTGFYTHAARPLTDLRSYLVSLDEAAHADGRMLLDDRFDLRRGRIARLASVQRRFLKERSDLLADRVHKRHIVDAHGDLRPEHICSARLFP